MPTFSTLLLVMAVAFAAPFVLGPFPRLQLPSVVLEIAAGIVIGPSVLYLVEVDQAVEVVALIGLAFVLFLAGLEIEFDKLRGRVVRLAAAGFALSFGIAVVVALGLSAAGLVETPLLVAIILCATSLGVLVPVLKDAGEISSTFGQLIIAAASIAPRRARRAPHRDRRADAVDVAAGHRGGDRHRARAQAPRLGDQRRAHRRRPAVRAALPLVGLVLLRRGEAVGGLGRTSTAAG